MRRGILLIAVVAAAGSAWAYWSPRLAARQLRTAAQRGDTVALQRLIDFPEVRRHMRIDIQAQAQRLSQDTTASPLAAGFAKMLWAGAAEGLIDSIVGPRSIATIAGLVTQYPTPRGTAPEITADMRYLDPSHFLILVHNRPGVPSDTASLTLERRGLSWRLIRVNFSRIVSP
jgi:hypothetical protein